MSILKNRLCSLPEIWGGLECTINRIGDVFRDQLSYTGHYEREGDIDRFAQLGIRALRYPVLWERHQPKKGKPIDWTATAQRLELIRRHGITPIAGLLHHGSGPAFTCLADDAFAGLLAGYARETAARFPWLQYYTPVNEPLTTARFSGLYGHWYPHGRDDSSFARMLVNQVKGVVLSMQAIREIAPGAKLVQTEDLAHIHSTPALAYQARFENERRWLTWDLLCGCVDRRHPLWHYLVSCGIKEKELWFFCDNACPPDIMGLNYYVTSERFLDENTARYPAHCYGGNGRHCYADVEMVRVGKPAGVQNLLTEAWRRYHIPVALTEVHLSCTPDEQMRWWHETWQSACLAKQSGVDLRAVTAWALLGSYDWNSLLTREDMVYETGVFDITHHCPEATPTAWLIRSLATQGSYYHPLLEEPGWWHKTSVIA